MHDLPTGTVTFLFTDIADSTTLWEQHPAAARVALTRHDELVEQIVAEHEGHIVRPRGEGDSRFAVFSRATDAVAAAAALQQALYAEHWLLRTPLRVRMALHTGEADRRDGDYYGSAVNRCARLRAVAHGGQILVSAATQELVRDSLPSGIELHELGAHRLKDLTRPEQVFQLVAPGLAAEFPPLRSLDARPHNLPVQRDPLIGREREVAEVVALLRRPEIGLVTLTGPGGTGKTRLSQQIAAEMLDDFPDGAWFVDLAALSDPALVLSTIAQTLGLKELADQPIAEMLAASLRSKQLLLVLDNFEQVLAAAATLTTLLRTTERLKLLVTSRELLRLSGEQDYPVPPLALPDLERREPVERLSQYAAVALFIQRAQAVKPDFQVTNETAPAVAEICVRLDGLPLAIELAAARIRLLPAEALLRRLGNRLKLLTGGMRDQAARQQTLRAAIDWSYKLLTTEEQVLFAQLGVFVGGWTLEAAEAVCQQDDLDLLDGIQSLLDKSLLRQDASGSDSRFTMLETIREFAFEQLVARDASIVQRNHADYFLAFAEDADTQLHSAEQIVWLGRLEAENENLRSALTWFVSCNEAESALRLAGALSLFWHYRGHYTEGRDWLEHVIKLGGDVGGAIRAKACSGVGTLAWAQGDYGRATEYHQQALTLYQNVGDGCGVAFTLNNLGAQAVARGAVLEAARLYNESKALYLTLTNSSCAEDILLPIYNLGELARDQGDYHHAMEFLNEAATRARAFGNSFFLVYAITALGDLARMSGSYLQAQRYFQESLELARTHMDRMLVAICLEGLASVAMTEDHQSGAELHTYHQATAWATRLLAAAEVLREQVGSVRHITVQADFEGWVALGRSRLSGAEFASAWAEGRAMTLEQAIAYALQEQADA